MHRKEAQNINTFLDSLGAQQSQNTAGLRLKMAQAALLDLCEQAQALGIKNPGGLSEEEIMEMRRELEDKHTLLQVLMSAHRIVAKITQQAAGVNPSDAWAYKGDEDPNDDDDEEPLRKPKQPAKRVYRQLPPNGE